MLQNQCELWSGPIAAVAYMPLVKGKLVSMDDAALNGTTVEEQKAKLAAFYASVTHAGQLSLDFCSYVLVTCNRLEKLLTSEAYVNGSARVGLNQCSSALMCTATLILALRHVS